MHSCNLGYPRVADQSNQKTGLVFSKDLLGYALRYPSTRRCCPPLGGGAPLPFKTNDSFMYHELDLMLAGVGGKEVAASSYGASGIDLVESAA